MIDIKLPNAIKPSLWVLSKCWKNLMLRNMSENCILPLTAKNHYSVLPTRDKIHKEWSLQ
jgi:hypothetical protein